MILRGEFTHANWPDLGLRWSETASQMMISLGYFSVLLPHMGTQRNRKTQCHPVTYSQRSHVCPQDLDRLRRGVLSQGRISATSSTSFFNLCVGQLPSQLSPFWLTANQSLQAAVHRRSSSGQPHVAGERYCALRAHPVRRYPNAT